MPEVGSTLKVEDLEKGKRYKVSFEGAWDGRVLSVSECGRMTREGLLPDAVSIEPLPDPEPEWKHGTVVMAPGHYHRAPIVRDANAGLWRFPDGSESKNHWNLRVSRAWQDGTLKILYTPED